MSRFRRPPRGGDALQHRADDLPFFIGGGDAALHAGQLIEPAEAATKAAIASGKGKMKAMPAVTGVALDNVAAYVASLKK